MVRLSIVFCQREKRNKEDTIQKTFLASKPKDIQEVWENKVKKVCKKAPAAAAAAAG